MVGHRRSRLWAGLFQASLLPAPAGVNHAPGLLQTESGNLLACWYSGSTEANADARILCADSADQGLAWSAPRTAVAPGDQASGAREANKSVGNVTLFEDAGHRLWMIHGVIQRWTLPLLGNLCLNWTCGRTDARFSTDAGATWSAAIRLDDAVGALPRNRPLHHPVLGDLVPLYREFAETAHLLSLDGARRIEIPGRHIIQPALALLPDGAIRAWFRDTNSVAVRSARYDPAQGAWSAVEATDLPNPNTAIDVLADGAGFLLVYNPSRTDRQALAIAASRDGVHFPRRCTLVAAGSEGDVAYPAVIRARDGSIHIAYSAFGKTQIRHLRFDAAWLEACLR